MPIPSRRQQKLQELLSIVGLLQAQQGSQHQQAQLAQQGQQGQQANMLAMLGLMQQGENQQATRDQNATEFAGRQVNDAATLALNNQHLQNTERASADHDKQMALNTVLEQYGRMPGATPEGLMHLASSGPEQFLNESKSAMTANQVGQMQGPLSAVYSQFGKDPMKAQGALDMLWQDPRMQSPDVQAGLAPFLQSQNEGLAKPGASAQPSGGLGEWGTSPLESIGHAPAQLHSIWDAMVPQSINQGPTKPPSFPANGLQQPQQSPEEKLRLLHMILGTQPNQSFAMQKTY